MLWLKNGRTGVGEDLRECRRLDRKSRSGLVVARSRDWLEAFTVTENWREEAAAALLPKHKGGLRTNNRERAIRRRNVELWHSRTRV